jgi:hypothetical protein
MACVLSLCGAAYFVRFKAVAAARPFITLDRFPAEYPLLRCNRTATKVLNTFRFGDLRACVLSVDTGIGNWAQRAVAMRTQQPHAAGSEPRGFISFLDNNGIYHEVFGGPGMAINCAQLCACGVRPLRFITGHGW